jgi:PHS family inorganic phosphate transporter-like MFS transporter
MGLRQWVSRPLRGHHIGVENLLRGGEGVPVSYTAHL